MTTDKKVTRRKLSVLELATELENLRANRSSKPFKRITRKGGVK